MWRKGDLIKASLVRAFLFHDLLSFAVSFVPLGSIESNPASSTAVLLPLQIGPTNMDALSPTKVQKRTNRKPKTQSGTGDMRSQARRGSQTDSSSGKEDSQSNASLEVVNKVQHHDVDQECQKPSTTPFLAAHKSTLTITITSLHVSPNPSLRL